MKTSFALLLSAALAAGPLRAVSQNPMDLLQEGLEAVLDERFEDASRSFHSVLQYDPGNQAAERGIKIVQQRLQQQIAQRRAQEKPALDAAAKAIKRDNWPEAADHLEGVLSRQKDHPEALALRDKIRARMNKQKEKAKPQSGDWFYAEGVLAYLAGDWLKAVDSWDQVVAFDPDQIGLVSSIEKAKENLRSRERDEKIRFLHTVAFDHLKKSDYAEAIRNWESLLELDPSNAQAKEGVAEAKKAWEAQKGRDRQEDIQKFSEQAMDAYIERDHKKSRALWNQVLELDPDNTLARDYLRRMGGGGASSGGGPTPESGYEKAMDFLGQGRLPEGIEYLERYISKFPNDQRAKSSLQQAREQQKAQADKAYQDGLMTYSQGDIPGAIGLWQSALRADPDYQRARQAIIKAMAEQRKQGQ